MGGARLDAKEVSEAAIPEARAPAQVARDDSPPVPTLSRPLRTGREERCVAITWAPGLVSISI